MPVAHLGLPVSHIPSATSFYLSALQPLGYHYIGQRGDSIGLGVADADFFLTQETRGARVAPCHVAFSADSRLAVRNCYAAALNAGARPSGPPSYRDGDCTTFNAAVEDLDGNTIEFVYREGSRLEHAEETITPAQEHRIQMWQKDVARSSIPDDAKTVTTKITQAKTRAHTALDLASTASKSIKKSEAPTQGIARSNTAPVAPGEEFPTKTFLGTILGAAAGAAIAFAMTKTEECNAKDEVIFNASVRSQSRRSFDDPPSPRSHRRYSMTETTMRRPPPGRLAIEPTSYYDNGTEVRHAISHYTGARRPQALQRSRTLDAIEYAPLSHSGRSYRSTPQRATTLPVNPPHAYIEAPRSTASRDPPHAYVEASRSNASRDSPHAYVDAPRSNASRRSSHHSHHSHHSTYDTPKLRHRDSGISLGSRRSHRTSEASRRSANSHRSRRGSAQVDSAVDVSLPASKRTSYVSAVDVPLPASKKTSYVSVSAAQVPIPESHGGGWEDDESDGMGDTETVVPDDSISCVDFSKPKRSVAASRAPSKRSSKRSEADSERTVRPAKPAGSKHSAMTMPMRVKEDNFSGHASRRSVHTYA